MIKPIKLIFVTSNKHKFSEARQILAPFGIKLAHKQLEYPEIRSDDQEEIAANAAREIYKKIRRPLFIDDSGFFIPALGGFPGTYSKWVYQKIGLPGILRLLAGKRGRQRAAYFQSTIAYCDQAGARAFVSQAHGIVSPKPLGKQGFGYDPIFLPAGRRKTFAQDFRYKQKISSRCHALTKLARFLKAKA